MEFKLINTEYLNTVTGGDKTVLSEIVGIFRAQVVEIADEMRVLLTRKDYHSLALLAHKAKSSVAIMGMNDLAAVLKRFELEGKEGKNTGSYNEYIARYVEDTKQAIIELDNYLNNL